MAVTPDSNSTSTPAEDLLSSFLYRTVRGAAELVEADGGTVSVTNLVSGERHDFSYGSRYRPGATDVSDRPPQLHARVSFTEAKKVWSPALLLKSERVSGALWLYRRQEGQTTAEFSDEDRRLVRIFLESTALGVEHALEVVRLRELLHWAGISTVRAMTHAIRAKDPYTSEHCERVADYGTCIAEAMGYENVSEVWAAGSVHDVGKIGILDGILDKPGSLGRTEMESVREHPVWGGEIVSHFTDEWNLAPAVKHHHEWVDGRGYPDQLNGETIPLTSRIITIADAFDAMTTDRPYRTALDTRTALNRLSASAGIQFDPQIVAIARDCLS